MSAKAREYDARIARVLHDAGARIIERGTDGNSHRTVTFQHHNQLRTFHYPCTGTTQGHGIRNMQQRLKWLIASIPPAVVEPLPEPPAPAPAPPPSPMLDMRVPPTPKLNRPSRREIVKRYIETSSIDKIMSEFSLSHDQAEKILLATAGSVRTTYIKERDALRAAKAKALRAAVIVKRRKPTNGLPKADRDARDRRICLYHTYGMTLTEIADLLDLTHERVRQIVRKQGGDA